MRAATVLALASNHVHGLLAASSRPPAIANGHNDAAVDAASLADASIDAGTDAGSDADIDAGTPLVDAGSDANADANVDAAMGVVGYWPTCPGAVMDARDALDRTVQPSPELRAALGLAPGAAYGAVSDRMLAGMPLHISQVEIANDATGNVYVIAAPEAAGGPTIVTVRGPRWLVRHDRRAVRDVPHRHDPRPVDEPDAGGPGADDADDRRQHVSARVAACSLRVAVPGRPR